MKIGINQDEICNRDGCKGTMQDWSNDSPTVVYTACDECDADHTINIKPKKK
jgi:hypothetical protein